VGQHEGTPYRRSAPMYEAPQCTKRPNVRSAPMYTRRPPRRPSRRRALAPLRTAAAPLYAHTPRRRMHILRQCAHGSARGRARAAGASAGANASYVHACTCAVHVYTHAHAQCGGALSGEEGRRRGWRRNSGQAMERSNYEQESIVLEVEVRRGEGRTVGV